MQKTYVQVLNTEADGFLRRKKIETQDVYTSFDTHMWLIRCLQPLRIVSLRTAYTHRGCPIVSHETDSCGVPVRPTWSVNTLLSSYPTPTISPATLSRLHELSALIPPPDGTQEHTSLKLEMEGLVKMVEAVKLVDTKDVHLTVTGDNPNADQQCDHRQPPKSTGQDASGQTLLNYTSRTSDRFYVVDADRQR